MATPSVGHGNRNVHRALNSRTHPFGGKKGYLWVTLALFFITLVGHWAFAWPAYVQEQQEQGQPVEFAGYFVQTSRDTLENWQSEFLQLCWQVAGLAILWYVGSPQSKEAEERTEEMLEHVLRAVEPDKADRILRDLEEKYPKK